MAPDSSIDSVWAFPILISSIHDQTYHLTAFFTCIYAYIQEDTQPKTNNEDILEQYKIVLSDIVCKISTLPCLDGEDILSRFKESGKNADELNLLRQRLDEKEDKIAELKEQLLQAENVLTDTHLLQLIVLIVHVDAAKCTR